MTTTRKKRPTAATKAPERRVNLTLTIAAAKAVDARRLPGELLSVAVSRCIERLDAVESTLGKLGGDV